MVMVLVVNSKSMPLQLTIEGIIFHGHIEQENYFWAADNYNYNYIADNGL